MCVCVLDVVVVLVIIMVVVVVCDGVCGGGAQQRSVEGGCRVVWQTSKFSWWCVVLRAAKVILQGWVVLGETMGVASVVQCLDILSELMMHVVGGGHMEN
jgi:hypothetical protein